MHPFSLHPLLSHIIFLQVPGGGWPKRGQGSPLEEWGFFLKPTLGDATADVAPAGALSSRSALKSLKCAFVVVDEAQRPPVEKLR